MRVSARAENLGTGEEKTPAAVGTSVLAGAIKVGWREAPRWDAVLQPLVGAPRIACSD